MKLPSLLILTLAAASPALAATSCGGAAPCSVKLGDYRIEVPKGEKPKGALVFFHGYASSAADQMKHRALVDAALKHGLAFVAVDGKDGVWSLPNLPEKGRNDPVFIDQVVSDVTKRFGIQPKDMVIGGFSLGASAAWYTVCREGDRFAASVTFSGVFWDPLPKPEDCTSAIPPMIHFHGRADKTFPLEGRALGGRFHQGNTFKSFGVVRASATCGPKRETKVIAGISCEVAPGCSRGESALCLHKGGHEVNPANLDAGLTELGF